MGDIRFVKLTVLSVGLDANDVSNYNVPYKILKMASQQRLMEVGKLYYGIIDNGVQYHFFGLITEEDKHANFKIFWYGNAYYNVINSNGIWKYQLETIKSEAIQF